MIRSSVASKASGYPGSVFFYAFVLFVGMVIDSGADVSHTSFIGKEFIGVVRH